MVAVQLFVPGRWSRADYERALPNPHVFLLLLPLAQARGHASSPRITFKPITNARVYLYDVIHTIYFFDVPNGLIHGISLYIIQYDRVVNPRPKPYN
jgi:hypothetical protein